MRGQRFGEEEAPHLAPDRDLAAPLPVHNSLQLTGEVAAAVDSVRVRVEGGVHEATISKGRFSAVVDTSGWARGVHPFTLEALSHGGSTTALAGSVDVEPYGPPPADEASVLEAVGTGRAAMWCEAPRLDGSATAAAGPEVLGWAIAPAGIARVVITIDGERRLRALYGLPRSDLRRAFGDELAAGCGFALRLDPEELGPGRHRLEVVAVAADGSALGMGGMVEVEGATEPRALEHGEGIEPSRSHHLRPPSRPAMFDAGFGSDRVAAAYRRYGAYAVVSSLGFTGRALDVGCQAGWGTALLAQEMGEVVGVDPSPPAIGDAERHWGETASFRRSDLDQLPFPDASFDLVVCLGALAQVSEPELELAEMRRVLRPGGALALVVEAGAGGSGLRSGSGRRDSIRRWLAERFSTVEALDLRLGFVATLGRSGADGRVSAATAPGATQVGDPGQGGDWVLLASDAALPGPSATVLLDAGAIEDERRHLTELWRERSVLGEVRMATLRTEAHYLSAANRKTLESAAARVAEAEAEVAAARAEVARLATTNAAMRGSRSWRLTGPLRAVGKMLRRLRG